MRSLRSAQDSEFFAVSEAAYEHKKIVPTYCAKCFSPIRAAIDDDSKQFYSSDLFCRCGRKPA
jgi:hypothetical protein